MDFSYYVLWMLLLVISFYDWTSYRIPNQYLICIVLSRVVWMGLFQENLHGFLSGFLFMLLIVLCISLFIRKGIGMGDKKLFLALSLYLPIEKQLLFLFLSFFLAACYAIVLRLRIHEKKLIPLAPFVTIAFLIFLLKGEL
ncbi:MAG: prepilin peptidase [Lachnospiraceae bacterium]